MHYYGSLLYLRENSNCQENDQIDQATENYFTKRFSSPAKSQINQDEQESIKALPGRRI